MLDYRYYTFLTLSNTLNYTKAAKELCITQPAVSQHIKYLEQELNCKLFDHSSSELQLTKQGALLKAWISDICADEKQVLKKIQQAESESIPIQFGATLTIGEYVLPARIATYTQKQKDARIKMIVENTNTLIQMLRHGDIQFAFVEGYFKKSDFCYRVLSKQRYIAVKHKDYKLKHPVHRLVDLLDEVLIVREEGSGTREILERVLAERNMCLNDFHEQMEIGNINAIKYLLEKRGGITFLYEAAIEKELAQGSFTCIPLEDFAIEREFSFIALSNSEYLTDYLAFLDAMKA